MTEILVPKLNANDTTYTLVEWIVPSGATVRSGDPVATVETSKAAEELPSPADGVLHHAVPVGAECGPGTVLGRLSGSEAERDRLLAPDPGAGDGGPVITEPALRAMADRGIPMAAVRALGRKVVRVADLAALTAAPPRTRSVRTRTSPAPPARGRTSCHRGGASSCPRGSGRSVPSSPSRTAPCRPRSSP
ncbi:hypothetical protein OHA72_49125 [Dactylosporangium sp. NBC_01737]|uniref:biotin/lipoyl-containing protein n=1 Tax=Dactylosporangium sp. NBC_01737 TaxID=2975959 RepID=UPI002E1212B3|nr:hypothetical protein OHA72_49125 [Dactylosporangium sp. NBC_01737]